MNSNIAFLVGVSLSSVALASLAAAASQAAPSNPFVALQGNYSGLFTNVPEAAWDKSGFFNLTVTSKGTFSAKLWLGGARHSASGVFDQSLAAQKRIVRKGTNDVFIAWQLTQGLESVAGMVTNSHFVSTLSGWRAEFGRANAPTNFLGKYNLIFSDDTNVGGIPLGYGFARVQVAKTGKVTVKGSLADSTPFAQTVSLSTVGRIPLYSKQGSIFGWLSLQSNSVTDVQGLDVLWTRAGGRKIHPAGFTNRMSVVGSRYAPPPSGTRVLSVGARGNAIIRLEAGNLPHPVAETVTLDARNKITVTGDNPGGLGASISVSIGLLNGSFRHDATGKRSAIKGVVLTRQNMAAGFFLGTNQSGSVLLGPGDDSSLPPPSSRYVNVTSRNPVSPYTSWATAARTIQQAIDVAEADDEIVVTNGVYKTGGRAVYGTLMNRVAVIKPVTVRSVNGPAVTVIRGSTVPGTTNGNGAVRCAYLTNGAVLIGFTLISGATRSTGDEIFEQSGGGAWCESASAVISNCTVTSNSAQRDGGGIFSGTLHHCVLSNNVAGDDGGGAATSVLNNCLLTGNVALDDGGGAERSALSHCTLRDNSAQDRGGGAYAGSLSNCVLTGNAAPSGGGASAGSPSGTQVLLNNCTLTGNRASAGGGTYYGMLNNCVLTGNAAMVGGGAYGGLLNNCTITGNSTGNGGVGAGVYWGELNNCIVYHNLPAPGSSASEANYVGGSLNYCCTTPLPAGGTNNMSADPQLASASHLSAGSPCRGAGSSDYAQGVDIDGQPWLNPPSIGCDEYHAGPITGLLTVAIEASYTNVAPGFAVNLRAIIDGQSAANRWEFDDGTIVSNQLSISHRWTTAGDHAVVLRAYNDTYPDGVISTFTVRMTEDVRYVSASSEHPTAPYTSWATAARNIQDAVDAVKLPGGLVLVSNGVYQTGARTVAGVINRVVLDTPVTLQSVNGLETTVIHGSGNVRCVYLADGAALIGFTLTGGFANTGGGVWSQSKNEVVSNCKISGNAAQTYGGGAFNGTLNNCALTDNTSAGDGGGAHTATLNNCTATGNSAAYGGAGVAFSTLNNCIAYFNALTHGTGPANHYASTVNYSCTVPLPAGGVGNVANDPELANFSHVSDGSPCRGAGNASLANGVDIDGDSWADPPSMGCDEYHAGALTGPLTLAIEANYTNVATGFAVEFAGKIDGRVSSSRWEFGEGTVASNRLYTSHAWATPGTYSVVLRAYNADFPAGIGATVTVQVVERPVLHVAIGSSNPMPPYDSWATAAWDIQDAIDAASFPGTVVLVSNGMYQTGWKIAGNSTNRVAVTKPMTVRSVNGPQLTTISGGGAMRCAYLANGSTLLGFTLTSGVAISGGGVWCESSSVVVSNCTLTGNSAKELGGGAVGGTLNNCTLANNTVLIYGFGGGGAFGSTLNDCVITDNSHRDDCGDDVCGSGGGGALGCVLNRCLLSRNSAYTGGGALGGVLNDCTITDNFGGYEGGGAGGATLNNCTLLNNRAFYGGGVSGGTLNNCVFIRNNAAGYGGGAYHSTLNNCTLAGNSARYLGGGASDSTFNNCIVYHNTVTEGIGHNYIGGTLNYSCTTPLPKNGVGNISAEPLFVNQASGDLRLETSSPCIDAGRDSYAPSGLDLDGNPRIVGGTVDMGAYEFQATPSLHVMDVRVTEGNAGTSNAVFAFRLVGRHPDIVSLDFATVDGTATSGIDYLATHGILVFTPDETNKFVSVPVLGDVLGEADETFFLRVSNFTNVNSLRTDIIGTILDDDPAQLYVNVQSLNPIPPYTNWATAATTIQDAIDAALPGDELIVTNGIYQSGGRAVVGTMTNRVAATMPLTIRSVNGPTVTVIRGYQVPGTRIGSGAVRCAYLAKGASLIGFTLTNGATVTDQSDGVLGDGGGAWCQAPTSIISQCILTGNHAGFGGGVAYGTLDQCVLAGNSVAGWGGGAIYSTLNDCIITNNAAYEGGGVSRGTLNRCNLADNVASDTGGGAHSSILNNCVLTRNRAIRGGGAVWGTLRNCTVTGNSAGSGGGGVAASALTNCVVYDNEVGTFMGGANFDNICTLNYCCTTPLPPGGLGNLTVAPLFVNQAGGNFRLQSNSPCINTGNNSYIVATADLDGRPRIVGGRVDIGAHEYQGAASGMFIGWLQQFGLPIDGSADGADLDGDRLNNYQEWRAGTDPKNAASVLRLRQPMLADGAPVVTWESVTGRSYTLEASSDLTSPVSFHPVATNIPGRPGTTSFTHRNIASQGPRYYRVSVEE